MIIIISLITIIMNINLTCPTQENASRVSSIHCHISEEEIANGIHPWTQKNIDLIYFNEKKIAFVSRGAGNTSRHDN
jgi:hypothetical protein